MKAARIAQVILVVLAGVYLWLFHTANPDYVELPFTRLFLPQLPDGFDGCDIGSVEFHPADLPGDPMPFLDGFESGDTEAWSLVAP